MSDQFDLHNFPLPPPGDRHGTRTCIVDYVPGHVRSYEIALGIQLGTIETSAADEAALEANVLVALHELREAWAASGDGVTLGVVNGVVEVDPPVQECVITFPGEVDMSYVDAIKQRLQAFDVDVYVHRTTGGPVPPRVVMKEDDTLSPMDGSTFYDPIRMRYRVVHTRRFLDAVANGVIEMKPEHRRARIRRFGDMIGCFENMNPVNVHANFDPIPMALTPRAADTPSLLENLIPIYFGLVRLDVDVEPIPEEEAEADNAEACVELVHWFLPNAVRMKFVRGQHIFTYGGEIWRFDGGVFGKVYV